jgi:uncharacterized protein
VSLFAVIYRPGPLWVAGVPLQGQDGIARHIDFLSEQLSKGKLIFAGPFLDDTGGVAIFDVPTSEELTSLLAQDETIARQLMSYDSHPCALPFMRSM